eukprot:203095_1
MLSYKPSKHTTEPKSDRKAYMAPLFVIILLILFNCLDYLFAFLTINNSCFRRVELKSSNQLFQDTQIPSTDNASTNGLHKILLLADIHVNILCPFSALWLKKMRRMIEFYHKPEKLVILGDLFRHSDKFYKGGHLYVPDFLHHFQAKWGQSVIGCKDNTKRCITIPGNHDPKQDTNNWNAYFAEVYTEGTFVGELIKFSSNPSKTINYLTLPWHSDFIDTQQLSLEWVNDLEGKLRNQSIDVILIHALEEPNDYLNLKRKFHDLFDRYNRTDLYFKLFRPSITLSGHTHLWDYNVKKDEELSNDDENHAHFVDEITLGTFNYVQSGEHDYGVLEIDEYSQRIYINEYRFGINRFYVLIVYMILVILCGLTAFHSKILKQFLLYLVLGCFVIYFLALVDWFPF